MLIPYYFFLLVFIITIIIYKYCLFIILNTFDDFFAIVYSHIFPIKNYFFGTALILFAFQLNTRNFLGYSP